MRDPRLDDPSATTRATSLLPPLAFPSVSSSLLPPLAPRDQSPSPTSYAYTNSAFSSSPHYSFSPSRGAQADPSTRPAAVAQAWAAGPPPAALAGRPPRVELMPRPQHAEAPAKPPAPVHRVYVLNCASCSMFLTDRGMRAVLLLKPNIILFSTDGAPCNASPAFPEDSTNPEEPTAERTCDCLTSSLACHGCGTTVGYHIVQPCVRCTSSVQKHQRSANHHRYVFHHNEVTSRERILHEKEAGIVTQHPATHSPVPTAPSRRTRELEKGEVDRFRNRQRTALSPFPPRRGMGELRVGDTVYWHNLAPGGERSRPIDPDTRRARAVDRHCR